MPATSVGPSVQCTWIYTSEAGFQARVGNETRAFKRLPPQKLHTLVHSEDAFRVPVGPPMLFYNAQLLHYGLQSARDVPAAIDTFKMAYAKVKKPKKLKVPMTVYAIKQALKTKYLERTKRSKENRIVEIQIRLAHVEQEKAVLKEELDKLEGESQASRPEMKMSGKAKTATTPSAKSLPINPAGLHNPQPMSSTERKRKASVPVIQCEEAKLEESHGYKVARLDKAPVHTHSQKPDLPTLPEALRKKLGALLFGKWNVYRAGSIEDLKSWICIGKQFGRFTGSQGLGQKCGENIACYTGRIEMSDFTAVFKATDLAKNCQMIGDHLRADFVWRSDTADPLFSGREGKLRIDFDGSKLSGTVWSGGLATALVFEGYNRVELVSSADSSAVGQWSTKYEKLAPGSPRRQADDFMVQVMKPGSQERRKWLARNEAGGRQLDQLI